MGRLGVITGLVREAECLNVFPAADRPAVAIAGANGRRAHECALALIGQGCDALLSFGIAGGLDPSLEAGALVVADSVVAPGDECLATDSRWRDSLFEAIHGEMTAISAPLAGAAAAVTTSVAKHELFVATGAAAVDLESLAVARAAAAAGVSFLALRAIADPASHSIPGAALRGVDANGNIRSGRVLAAILAKPWELPALILLARDSARALDTLRRAALIGGPGLGTG